MSQNQPKKEGKKKKKSYNYKGIEEKLISKCRK